MNSRHNKKCYLRVASGSMSTYEMIRNRQLNESIEVQTLGAVTAERTGKRRHYSRIMLIARMCILFLKLCQHNRHKPSQCIHGTGQIVKWP